MLHSNLHALCLHATCLIYRAHILRICQQKFGHSQSPRYMLNLKLTSQGFVSWNLDIHIHGWHNLASLFPINSYLHSAQLFLIFTADNGVLCFPTLCPFIFLLMYNPSFWYASGLDLATSYLPSPLLHGLTSPVSLSLPHIFLYYTPVVQLINLVLNFFNFDFLPSHLSLLARWSSMNNSSGSNIFLLYML